MPAYPSRVGEPPRRVLDAFGVVGVPEPLPGGAGRSIRVANAVYKQVDDEAEAQWAAEVLDTIDENGFRLARPLRAADGAFVVAGWTASRWVSGENSPPRWAQLLAASRAFHAAAAGLPRPAFLDGRTHRWARADRVAWGEAAGRVVPELMPLLRRLEALRAPVTIPAQVVHGDLSGNLLYHPVLAPAIVDFSPYYRPVAYAEAVAVVDGLLWYDADPRLVDAVGGDQPIQMLVRAAIFRLVAASERAREHEVGGGEDVTALESLVTVLEQAS